MSKFGLEDLQDIVRAVLGDSSITLAPDADASAVPGWDSLQHTLIILEINQQRGIDLDPGEAAKIENFDALVRVINEREN